MDKRDAMLGKISNIKNCMNSIARATKLDPQSLDDLMIQDVFVLNLERAAQACIDLAHLVIAERGFELPRSYRHSFEILRKENYISAEICENMARLAGFRNIAIHEYTSLNIDILKAILTKHLKDIEVYYETIYLKLKLGSVT